MTIVSPAIPGIPPELAARVPGFAALGIDRDKVIGAIRRYGPERGPATPGWAAGMIAEGNAMRGAAEAAERHGDTDAARDAFLEASFWYFFSRFAHILGPEAARSYALHRDAYARAAQHFRKPVLRFDILFAGATVPAMLRLPAGATGRMKLAMIWGGIDVWKSDLEIHDVSEALLRRGIATLALNGPGTGECPVPAAPAAGKMFLAARDAVRRDGRFDPARIGAYGLSFGGHFAARLALADPSLAGVVQVGGPVHLAFAPDHVARLPVPTRLALARVAGLQPSAATEPLAASLGALSLLEGGALPATAHAPLLSINGDADELVPIADLHLLSEQGVRQDRLIFAGDRHCASGNWHLHTGFAADWLAARLGA